MHSGTHGMRAGGGVYTHVAPPTHADAGCDAADTKPMGVRRSASGSAGPNRRVDAGRWDTRLYETASAAHACMHIRREMPFLGNYDDAFTRGACTLGPRTQLSACIEPSRETPDRSIAYRPVYLHLNSIP